MVWLDRMNHVMDYLETHLTETIEMDKVAQIAWCSTYHFQRMFSFITGVPLSEYIRRRRLTMAAFELQNTNAKVIDLAFKYGYESHEAFSRAFSKLHGVPPMSARDKGIILKAYPPMSFHISIKGDREMNYHIKEREAFEVFGLELQTNLMNGQCYKDIAEFWGKCVTEGKCTALLQASGKKAGELLDAGVTYAHKPDGSMNYMIACIKRTNDIPSEYKILKIPAQTWAIFSVDWKDETDDTNLHEAWQRIYSEWFPVSGFEHADCDFDLEIYSGQQGIDSSLEIWIPIQKTQNH